MKKKQMTITQLDARLEKCEKIITDLENRIDQLMSTEYDTGSDKWSGIDNHQVVVHVDPMVILRSRTKRKQQLRENRADLRDEIKGKYTRKKVSKKS